MYKPNIYLSVINYVCLDLNIIIKIFIYMIPIYEPYLSKYHKSANEAIETNWISDCGENVRNAEEKLKSVLNVSHCILTNNGTSATHCLILSIKYKYPHINKIYVPNNVFVAPWNCVLNEYPSDKIEVMKIDRNTLNIDTSEKYIENLELNSAVVIVHNLGNIVNVPRLKRIRPDIIFVEDNCEGLFGKYEGLYSGTSTSSLCSAISFYANKTLTTGEGGAFITNDNDVYEHIRSVYSHRMTKTRYIHDVHAHNYRMSNIQAGFLFDQLNDLEHILKLKEELFNKYDHLLEGMIHDGKVIKIKSEECTIKANWIYCIVISDLDYESIETYMSEHNVQIRPLFYDIRYHNHLKDIYIKYNDIEIKGIMLPSFPSLNQTQQEYIIECLIKYLDIYNIQKQDNI